MCKLQQFQKTQRNFAYIKCNGHSARLRHDLQGLQIRDPDQLRTLRFVKWLCQIWCYSGTHSTLRPGAYNILVQHYFFLLCNWLSLQFSDSFSKCLEFTFICGICISAPTSTFTYKPCVKIPSEVRDLKQISLDNVNGYHECSWK